MSRFAYRRLARHCGIWRVDGIGPIEDRGRLGGRAIVYFSGLTEDGLGAPYKTGSLNGEVLSFRIHSASISAFRVGSIWRDGKRIAGPPPLPRPFRIDAGQARLVPLEQAIHLNGYWAPTVLPDRYLSFGGSNRAHLISTLYAIVPVLDDSETQWLVVPASELLRFYVGVSSRLLSGSLQGRLEDLILWKKSRMENGYPVLHLRQRISRKEAMVLSRSVASEDAMAALLGVHQHLSVTRSNNSSLNEASKRPLVIKAHFPFTDTSQLYVAGKKMPLVSRNGDAQWAVFAMEILTCSHPAGFHGFILESDAPFETPARPDGAPDSGPPRYQPLLEEDNEDELALDDLPADKRLARLVVLSFTNQFSGFEGLHVEHRRPRAEYLARQPGAQIDIAVDTLTIEDGNYAKEAEGIAGVSEFHSKIEQVDRELVQFLDMLEYFRAATENRGWRVTTRRLTDSLPQNREWVACFPANVGKRRSWHMLTDATGKKRPRQLVWVEVAVNNSGEYFNLFEMELKPGEKKGQCTILLHTNDFSQLDEPTYKKWLVLTAIKNRWPARHHKWPEAAHEARAKDLFAKVQAFRIHHPHPPRAKDSDDNKNQGEASRDVSPKAWSEVLLEKIDELI